MTPIHPLKDGTTSKTGRKDERRRKKKKERKVKLFNTTQPAGHMRTCTHAGSRQQAAGSLAFHFSTSRLPFQTLVSPSLPKAKGS